MSGEDSSQPSDWSWSSVVLPFLLVFVVHGAVVLLAPLDSPFVKYNAAAWTYLAGQMPRETLVDYSAVYLQLVIVIEGILRGPPLSFAFLTWLQVTLVAASASLLFVALRRRFSLSWATLGLILFTVQTHLMTAEQVFEPEVCLLFFLLGCIVAADGRTPRAAAIAGIFASLALATRPTFVFIFLLAPGYYWIQGFRGRPLLQRSLLFLAPILLATAALNLQAMRATGNWNAPRMSPGLVFYSGNNPISVGLNADYPPVLVATMETTDQRADPAHAISRSIATEDARRVLTIAEANDYWLQKSIGFVRDQPGRFAAGLWRKFVHALSAFRWNDVPTVKVYESERPETGMLYSLIASLALLGAFVELRHWKRGLLFYIFGAAQGAVMVLFYVSARHQTVLIPSLVYFSAAACERMARRDARSVLILALWLPLWALLSLPDDFAADGRHVQLGEAALRKQLQQAQGMLARLPSSRQYEIAAEVLAATPWMYERALPVHFDIDGRSVEQAAVDILRQDEERTPSEEFDLAYIEYLAEDWGSADRRFEQLTVQGRRFYRSYLQSSQPLFYRGRIALLRGDPAEGVRLLEAALDASPGDPWVLADLYVATGDEVHREQLARYFSGLDADWLIGSAQLHHGRYADAERSLKRLLLRIPDFRSGIIAHAVALGRSGQLDRGAKTLLLAWNMSEHPIYLPDEVVDLMERWARAHASDAEVAVTAATVIASHGRFDAALRLLEHFDDDQARVESARARLRRSRGL